MINEPWSIPAPESAPCALRKGQLYAYRAAIIGKAHGATVLFYCEQ
jgi:hypothetical protein